MALEISVVDFERVLRLLGIDLIELQRGSHIRNQTHVLQRPFTSLVRPGFGHTMMVQNDRTCVIPQR